MKRQLKALKKARRGKNFRRGGKALARSKALQVFRST
jgi:hypothetical protein